MKKGLISLFFLWILVLSNVANAAIVRVGWKPNSESDMAKYRVYYGEEPEEYLWSVDIEEIDSITMQIKTSVEVAGLMNGYFYVFAVSALDTSNNESQLSNGIGIYVPFTVGTGVDSILLSLFGIVAYDSESNQLQANTISGNSTSTSTTMPASSTSTEMVNMSEIVLPYLNEGDVVLFEFDGLYYRNGSGTEIANVPFRIKDKTITSGNSFISAQYDALVPYMQTAKMVPVIINYNCSYPALYMYFGLQSGFLGMSNPHVRILRDQSVITKLFINRLVKTTTGVGIEVMWETLPDVTTYEIWASYSPDAYIYNKSKNFIDTDVEGNFFIIDVTTQIGMYIFVRPVGGEYAQMISYLPFNVVGHEHEGLMHHQIVINTYDWGWVTSHLNQIPIDGAGDWANINGFSDNIRDNKVTSADITKIRARSGKTLPLGIN